MLSVTALANDLSKILKNNSESKDASEIIETKGSFWSVGWNAMYLNLRDGSDAKINGVGGVVSLGPGYIGKQFIVEGAFDLYVGPFSRALDDSVRVPHRGLGATFNYYYNLRPQELRSSSGNFGMGLSLSYMNISGTNENSVIQDDLKIDGYNMKFKSILLSPLLFYSSLKEARLDGFSPEYLVTRIEGYMFTLSLGYPVYSRYTVGHSEIVDFRANRHSKSGKFRGFSIVLGAIVLLGI
jgi:hypothetical protein